MDETSLSPEQVVLHPRGDYGYRPGCKQGLPVWAEPGSYHRCSCGALYQYVTRTGWDDYDYEEWLELRSAAVTSTPKPARRSWIKRLFRPGKEH